MTFSGNDTLEPLKHDTTDSQTLGFYRPVWGRMGGYDFMTILALLAFKFVKYNFIKREVIFST